MAALHKGIGVSYARSNPLGNNDGSSNSAGSLSLLGVEPQSGSRLDTYSDCEVKAPPESKAPDGMDKHLLAPIYPTIQSEGAQEAKDKRAREIKGNPVIPLQSEPTSLAVHQLPGSANRNESLKKWPLPAEVLDAWEAALPYIQFALDNASKGRRSAASRKHGIKLECPEYVGPTLATARPVVAVRTEDKEAAKIIKDAFKTCRFEGCLTNLLLRFPGSGQTSKARFPIFRRMNEDKTGSSALDPPDDEDYKMGATELHYGSLVYAFREDRFLCSVTIGGFILLDLIPFAITAGHLSVRSEDFKSVVEDGNDMEREENDPEEWFNTHDWELWDPKDDFPECTMDTPSSTIRADRSDDQQCSEKQMPRILEIMEEPIEQAMEVEPIINFDGVLDEKNAFDRISPGDHVTHQPVVFRLRDFETSPIIGTAYFSPYRTNNSPSFSSRNDNFGAGQSLQNDWMLIILANHVQLPPPKFISAPNGSLMHDCITQQDSFSSTRVSIISERLEHVLGVVNSGPDITLMPGADSFERTWSMKMSEELGGGCSGTWLQDERGHLLGQIVAEVPSTRSVLFLPACDLFESISRHFPNKIQSWIPVVKDGSTYSSMRNDDKLIYFDAHDPRDDIPGWWVTQNLPDHHTGGDKSGRALLHLAADHGHLSAIKYLLTSGADIDVKSKLGWTALHFGIRRLSGIQELIGSGANLNIADLDGATPLHFAARWGTVGVVTSLLRAGANLFASTNEQRTPLYYAVQTGTANSTEIVRALLAAGANPNASDHMGVSPLHIAALHSDKNENALSALKLLLAAGADVNARTSTGLTPLHYALNRGAEKIVKRLRLAGAQPVMVQDRHKRRRLEIH